MHWRNLMYSARELVDAMEATNTRAENIIAQTELFKAYPLDKRKLLKMNLALDHLKEKNDDC